MTDSDLVRIEARLAEAQDFEERAAARVKELREALATARLAESTVKESDLEARLEAGPWKEAISKKCDYWRDAPSDLVQAVRTMKGGIKGQVHHFTASATEPTLFRFVRGTKK